MPSINHKVPHIFSKVYEKINNFKKLEGVKPVDKRTSTDFSSPLYMKVKSNQHIVALGMAIQYSQYLVEGC